tara:strand:- start:157 stop:309 length:153 start_codon:yes stop_codon:yes gene_type:complete
MGDDVKKNQDLLTKKAMEKERVKRESGTSSNYTFKHLGHKIIKFDGYTRG